jgi:tetratricopeptide (TPR) repeat protein
MRGRARVARRGARARGGAALGVALLLGAGCQSEPTSTGAPHRSITRVAESGDVGGPTAIDQELMIALAQAKNYHHKAKVLMSDGNLAAATAAVRQILSLRFPAGAAEADDVRLDARALLAKLLISQGQLDEAARTVSEGLAQAARESFFVANLHTVMGEIHEARAAQREAAGDPAQAAQEKRAAIAAFDRSIQINEVLQKRLMGEP